MGEIDVPPYFLCPISLEIMRDPVTVSTGITYDRHSIEKWLFSGAGADANERKKKTNNTCPVTKQVVVTTDPDSLIIPNHTLRRLIQAWCTLNASHGIERFPTPRPPASRPQIIKLLSDASNSTASLATSLKSLRSIAAESDANKRCIESAPGAVEFLASVVSADDDDHEFVTAEARDDALTALCQLKLSETGLQTLLLLETDGHDRFTDSLVTVMQRGGFETRTYAVMLLKQVFDVADPNSLAGLRVEVFAETVRMLRDEVSQQATRAALHLLVHLCQWGRNRVKAVEAGAVPVLVEFLLEHSRERRGCEAALAALEQACGCAEGRAALVGHGAGLAAVSKRILRVSELANEKAVRVLAAVAKWSASPSVLQEMAEVGVVSKLCLVMQVGCGSRTKEKAAEILKLHAAAWKKSPCVPSSTLFAFFPH